MGQGLYRCLGFGCLNPPKIDWDAGGFGSLYNAIKLGYEAEPDYMILPLAVDDEWLQHYWGLPELPEQGLPHVAPRTAVEVESHMESKDGVFIPHRAESLWRLLREAFAAKGIALPDGKPIFVCDWG